MSTPLDDSATTLSEALREGRQTLSMSNTETPGLDAEVLLRHILGFDRVALFSRFSDPMSAEHLANYRALLRERSRGTPVAYLTGKREFMGLSFAVSPGVLVPRPETEILVEWAIVWLQNRNASTVIDVGTGSGAIALAIASAMGADWPGEVIAVDVSPEAIAMTSQNRERLGLQNGVQLQMGSLLSWRDEPVDLVLANLPYLQPEQIAENPDLRAEPLLALDGGPDGLDLIRQLLSDAPRVLRSGGALGLEIDPAQRDAVTELAHTLFPGSGVHVLQDLAGFDRHVIIQTVSPGHLA